MGRKPRLMLAVFYAQVHSLSRLSIGQPEQEFPLCPWLAPLHNTPLTSEAVTMPKNQFM